MVVVFCLVLVFPLVCTLYLTKNGGIERVGLVIIRAHKSASLAWILHIHIAIQHIFETHFHIVFFSNYLLDLCCFYAIVHDLLCCMCALFFSRFAKVKSIKIPNHLLFTSSTNRTFVLIFVSCKTLYCCTVSISISLTLHCTRKTKY